MRGWPSGLETRRVGHLEGGSGPDPADGVGVGAELGGGAGADVIADAADDNRVTREGEAATAESVLDGVLANTSAELSAHQTIMSEQDAWTSIAELAPSTRTSPLLPSATAGQC